MINPFKEVNWNPQAAEKRQFARSLIIGFPVLAVIWLTIGKVSTGTWMFPAAGWLAAGGVAIGGTSWAFPAIAKPFYVLWYGVACSIGLVVSNTLLITFYLTVMTAFGVLRRAIGRRQPLKKRAAKGAISYWHDADTTANAKRYFSQF